MVETGCLLREPQRVGERKQLNPHADLHPPGPTRNGTANNHWSAQRRMRTEVKLREPETVHAQCVGDFRESHPFFERGVLVGTFTNVECAEDSEFHASLAYRCREQGWRGALEDLLHVVSGQSSVLHPVNCL